MEEEVMMFIPSDPDPAALAEPGAGCAVLCTAHGPLAAHRPRAAIPCLAHSSTSRSDSTANLSLDLKV